MKSLILLLFILFAQLTQAQKVVGGDIHKVKSKKSVTFIAKIDTLRATKEGIYLNDYVVNISHDRIRELHGKTVQVKGKVTIIKAIKLYDGGVVEQGRTVDTKYIESPEITILKN